MTLLFILLVSTANANEATQQATTALYKQIGAEEYFNTLVKDLDNAYLTDSIRSNAGVALFLLQCSIKQQITFKWEF